MNADACNPDLAANAMNENSQESPQQPASRGRTGNHVGVPAQRSAPNPNAFMHEIRFAGPDLTRSVPEVRLEERKREFLKIMRGAAYGFAHAVLWPVTTTRESERELRALFQREQQRMDIQNLDLQMKLELRNRVHNNIARVFHEMVVESMYHEVVKGMQFGIKRMITSLVSNALQKVDLDVPTAEESSV